MRQADMKPHPRQHYELLAAEARAEQLERENKTLREEIAGLVAGANAKGFVIRDAG